MIHAERDSNEIGKQPSRIRIQGKSGIPVSVHLGVGAFFAGRGKS
jgi:hypothetical protein